MSKINWVTVFSCYSNMALEVMNFLENAEMLGLHGIRIRVLVLEKLFLRVPASRYNEAVMILKNMGIENE